MGLEVISSEAERLMNPSDPAPRKPRTQPPDAGVNTVYPVADGRPGRTGTLTAGVRLANFY
jgi:hypothetical protein